MGGDREQPRREGDGSLEDTNAALYEIAGGNQMVYGKFPAEALCYVTDETEREVRFWDAFHNLSRFGFVYEVIQVWSADPEKDKKAVPLYTLYVKSRHAREQGHTSAGKYKRPR